MNLFKFFRVKENNAGLKRTTLFIMVLLVVLSNFYFNETWHETMITLFKCLSFYFIIAYGIMIFSSHRQHIVQDNDRKILYYKLEVFPILYISFAIYYLMLGAWNLDVMSQVAWVMLDDIHANAMPGLGDKYTTYLFNQYKQFFPVILILTITILIINASRSYYHIHELESNSNGVNKRSKFTLIDFMGRFLIALFFILLEKKISKIGSLININDELKVIAFDEILSFSYIGIVLFSLILLWLWFTHKSETRKYHWTQYMIGICGLIFSLILWYIFDTHINTQDGLENLLKQIIMFALMSLAMIVSGGILIGDFLSTREIIKSYDD